MPRELLGKLVDASAHGREAGWHVSHHREKALLAVESFMFLVCVLVGLDLGECGLYC
jgi:hypothetical protein